MTTSRRMNVPEAEEVRKTWRWRRRKTLGHPEEFTDDLPPLIEHRIAGYRMAVSTDRTIVLASVVDRFFAHSAHIACHVACSRTIPVMSALWVIWVNSGRSNPKDHSGAGVPSLAVRE